MPKHPYLPLYTGDWLKDAALSRCTPATRGVWIDLLCGMHELDRCGQLAGTATELARLCRCSARELVSATNELQTSGAAIVQRTDKVITVCNRRMHADYERRKALAAKQKQRRDSARGSPCNNGSAALFDNDIEIVFEQFWEEFPRGRRKSKARAREAFEKALEKTDAETLIAAAKAYAASDAGRGEFVQMPSSWLNQECWNDDREAWRSRDGKQSLASDYKKIPREDFAQLIKDQEFLTGPYKDKPNVNGFCRAFGTLKNGRKVESNNNPDWKP